MIDSAVFAGKKELFILGVIHRDSKGKELLAGWIERIMPDIITMEFSEYSFRFRKEYGTECKKRIMKVFEKIERKDRLHGDDSLSRLLSYFDMPYEYEAASDYTGRHACKIYLVDIDYYSYIKLQKIEELLDENNIRQLLREDKNIANGYEKILARLFFESNVKTVSYHDEMYVRDKYMRDKISVLMKHHKGKRFLHICGWQHLQDPYRLYDALYPEKVFIYDKTFCI